MKETDIKLTKYGQNMGIISKVPKDMINDGKVFEKSIFEYSF